MVRLRRIELQNVKNVEYGSIDFDDLRNGASIAGIYGPNGSGKTAVIEALDCIKRLMSGEGQADHSADLVGAAGSVLKLTARYELDDRSHRDELGSQVEYQVSMRNGGSGLLSVVGESLSYLPRNGRKRLLIEHVAPSEADDVPASDGVRALEWDYRPKAQWKSLFSFNGEARLMCTFAEGATLQNGKSFLFSQEFLSALRGIAKGCDGEGERTGRTVPATVRAAYESIVKTLLTAIPVLQNHALTKTYVIPTAWGLAPSVNVLIFSSLADKEQGGYHNILKIDTDRPCDLTTGDFDRLSSTIPTINDVLSSLVPGYGLKVQSLGSVALPNGDEGRRIELMSVRNGIAIPFRCESEGIQKITTITSLLIDVYNDADSCIVIDELDSGVFELLLGELLETLAGRGKGQLIFTAHNLRALETLPPSALVFTTTNPKKRFIRFKGVRPTNNLRDMYLRALNLGGQEEEIYEQPGRFAIDSSFYRAGHPNRVDFDELVSQLRGDALEN